MSGVGEVWMESVEEPRSGMPSGEPEASREVRWRRMSGSSWNFGDGPRLTIRR